MKILYFSPHPDISSTSPSGSGRHIREMILAFEEQGHDVQKWIVGDQSGQSGQNPQPQTHRLKSVLKRLIPRKIKTAIKDKRMLTLDQEVKAQLEGKIREFFPDVIYERGIYLMSAGTEIAKKYNIKHVWEVNAPFIEEKIYMQGKSYLNTQIQDKEKYNLLNTDLVVFVSKALEVHFQTHYPFIQDKTLVTPNGINLSDIKSTDKDKTRENLALKDEEIIGFVGSIFPYHGVDLLIKAFAEVRSQHPNTKLLIVGDGEILPDLKKLSCELKVEGDVIFTGSVNQDKVFEYIDIFDIAVMVKSNWYGSPVKIFEYGGMKKAIIAPNQPPVNEVMDHNIDGLIVDENVNAIYKSIMELLSNHQKRDNLAESFNKKVKENYNWRVNAISVITALSVK